MREYPPIDGTELPSYGPSYDDVYDDDDYDEEPAYVRRMLTAQIIQLANKAEGGTTSLVSVEETGDATRIVFETDYYIQNLPTKYDPIRKQVKRYTVWIAQQVEDALDA